jgi:hypothetical protein
MNKNYAPIRNCTDANENSNNTVGWSPQYGTFSSESDGGTGYQLKILENNTAANPIAYQATQSVVKPGETYTFAGIAVAGTEETFAFSIYDYTNLSWIVTAATALGECTVGGTNWSYTFTVPSGCVLLRLYLEMKCLQNTGKYLYFKNVSFTKTSTDDLTLVVDKAAAGTSSVVSLFHDGVQVGTSQTITNTAGKDVILAGKNHYLSGDYGSSLLKKRRFALGSELSSGTTSANKAYKITATQANYFFTGCAIGNIFMTNTAKTFDANNKAQEVILP